MLKTVIITKDVIILDFAYLVQSNSLNYSFYFYKPKFADKHDTKFLQIWTLDISICLLTYIKMHEYIKIMLQI